MKLKSNINLGASFDRLKTSLQRADEARKQDKPYIDILGDQYAIVRAAVEITIEEVEEKETGFPTIDRHTTANENVDDVTPTGLYFHKALNWDGEGDVLT